MEFDPDEGRTHQSFRDECDATRIVETYARTGIVTHVNEKRPQYGDAPTTTLLEAAVAQAEIRSALEDGWNPPEAPSDAPEGESEVQAEENPIEAPAASQAAETPTEG